MHRDYRKWFSPNLNRDMELLVYGDRGARVLVFPTRAGRFFDYENFGQVRALSQTIEQGNLQLFCLDSIDSESLYCDWCRPEDRMVRHEQYEQYVLREALPFTACVNPNPYLISHGCSLGAYHAVNIAFRHPYLFHKVVAFSGRYDLTMSTGSFRGLLDGYYDERVYFNNPSHYMAGMHDYRSLMQFRGMEIVMTIGEEDAFLNNNLEFSEILGSKGIAHSLHIWDGEAHRPRYWRKMAPLYL